eukprot:TRINITY_DN1011_c0_g1_i1.p1 TRINITY_DN1011_c0_g1~~TRINITY_DN1011_c0_g1_i1.p1  ORF type:complete len:445 (-),score=125.63 TRINITY_DN1011_c0_g1_i1:13-1347(-)
MLSKISLKQIPSFSSRSTTISIKSTKKISRKRNYHHRSIFLQDQIPYEDTSKIVTQLEEAWVEPEREGMALPTYRLMDKDSRVLNESEMPEIDDEKLVTIYKEMVLLNEMDSVCYSVQRQGVISFYMTNYGEEAAQFGSASMLDQGDMIFSQYREAGVLLHRGFTLDEFMNQLFSNQYDYGKGRQMPVHYGKKELNFQTISSPLGTQIPQATGAAYAYARQGKDNCVAVYFGDGAASEGDFHAALNFAATLEAPVLFICRNNKYAISTPTRDQYRGDAIAGRGVAYGIHTIRADGNDIFAVMKATAKARKIAVEESKPVLLEFMTYRIGHHSTSDDSERYREKAEIQEWLTTGLNPIVRLKNHLVNRGLWNEEQDKALIAEHKKAIVTALRKAQTALKPPITDLFEDVYDKMPQNLIEQQEELRKHLEKYPDSYKLEENFVKTN